MSHLIDNYAMFRYTKHKFRTSLMYLNIKQDEVSNNGDYNWLHIILLPKISYSYGDITITDEGLKKFTTLIPFSPLSREGIHCFDTGLQLHCLLRRYLSDSNLDPHGKILELKEILKYSPNKRPKTLKRHLFLFPKVTKSHRWRVDRHSFPKEIL